ncbi:MAG TPA: hypothetical protein VFL83_04590 [Anaeromyxobacter sp.]|nr:hypothetical protein [Anaeromyxobacter sp.]
MDRTLFVVCLIVTIFVGFQAGYSLAPFLDAGVLGGREEKGVESKIDDALKRHYERLYRQDE